MALCESSNQRISGQNAEQIVIFYSRKYFRCGWYKQQNNKTIQSYSKESQGPTLTFSSCLS